jgi:hypothetical protein
MKISYGRPGRRELAFVFSFALAGLLLVMVVAFAPWYSAVTVAVGR